MTGSALTPPPPLLSSAGRRENFSSFCRVRGGGRTSPAFVECGEEGELLQLLSSAGRRENFSSFCLVRGGVRTSPAFVECEEEEGEPLVYATSCAGGA